MNDATEKTIEEIEKELADKRAEYDEAQRRLAETKRNAELEAQRQIERTRRQKKEGDGYAITTAIHAALTAAGVKATPPKERKEDSPDFARDFTLRTEQDDVSVVIEWYRTGYGYRSNADPGYWRVVVPRSWHSNRKARIYRGTITAGKAKFDYEKIVSDVKAAIERENERNLFEKTKNDALGASRELCKMLRKELGLSEHAGGWINVSSSVGSHETPASSGKVYLNMADREATPDQARAMIKAYLEVFGKV